MKLSSYVYFVVNLLSQLILIFPSFLGMAIHANEFGTKEKQKLTKIKKLTATYTPTHAKGNNSSIFLI